MCGVSRRTLSTVLGQVTPRWYSLYKFPLPRAPAVSGLFVFGSRSGILNGCSKTFLLGQLVVFSQSYERGSILVTTNLPFDEWTEVFGSERLTGALLDRLTHHVHIIEMNGDSYRLKASRQNAVSSPPEEPADA